MVCVSHMMEYDGVWWSLMVSGGWWSVVKYIYDLCLLVFDFISESFYHLLQHPQ